MSYFYYKLVLIKAIVIYFDNFDNITDIFLCKDLKLDYSYFER